jgi:hypothetical protein
MTISICHTYIHDFINSITGWRAQVGKVPTSFPEGLGFNSRPKKTDIPTISSMPPFKCWDGASNLAANASWHIPPNRPFTKFLYHATVYSRGGQTYLAMKLHVINSRSLEAPKRCEQNAAFHAVHVFLFNPFTDIPSPQITLTNCSKQPHAAREPQLGYIYYIVWATNSTGQH